MTRVLLVSRSAKPGGAERALAALARHLPAFGIEPVVVLLERGPAEGWLAAAGCHAVIVEEGAAGPAEAIERLRELLREARPTAVVSNKWDGHLRGGAAAAAEAIPAVWWQHDAPGRSPVELAAAAVPAAAIVCSSGYAARAQRRLTPEGAIVEVHPGVAVRDIAARCGSGASVRRVAGWEGCPVVGIVARLEPWKGQETFLRAARLVSRRHPAVRYAVVGGAVLGTEGSYPDDLRALADELGVASQVDFVPHQADVYPWLDALDVVVHATHGEPFGLVLVEAMALGKPLIATGLGGPAEVVVDGESGLLVPPGWPIALADAICRVLDDPSLASALGRRAAERALAFTEEHMAERFARILRRVAI